ncbi:thiol:disulfide interchange protein, TlpA_like family [Flavobacterium gilvum]|nr:thiol:disulfide interchange protein, TlpA_like family [Flavobacterium gilvum]
MDSSVVKNNTFLFKTKIGVFPIQTVLFNRNLGTKTIWLERNTMTFNSTENSFSNAVITGSKTDSLVGVLRKEMRALKTYEEIVENEMKFIQNNPNSILSAHNLSIMASVFGKKKSTELFSKMSDENKKSEYGKRISSLLLDLNDLKAIEIGEKYRDFSMKNQNEIEKKLSDLNGKVVLLEFWASWCSPCRAENPNLVNTYNKFKSSGFEIFAVSLDDNKDSWLKAIQKDGLNWEHVSDLKGRSSNKAALLYHINTIPENILIDRNGFVIGRNLRGEDLNNKLSEILSAPSLDVKQEKKGTTIKIPNSMIWKDENGKVLSESELETMINSRNYIPHIDTVKNTAILKKI